MDKKAVIQWYKENEIEDVIENESCNHFLLENIEKKEEDNLILSAYSEKKILIQTQNSTEKTKISVSEKTIISKNEVKQEFNFNYIYQNLANKYKNDNTKVNNENNVDLETIIQTARNLANQANTIEELKDIVENFDGYLDIKKIATNTVFGEGDQNAKIMIIGEAPGNNEDIEGRPFCGQNGELLNNMFKSINIKREDLYITNTLFWRPPGNRTPTEEEISICRPFVEKHIFLINPTLIVFMGATALKYLIPTDLTITNARQHIFEYTNVYLNDKIIKTTPLFHPSYLLRQSSKKKDTWGDLLFIKNIINN